MGSGASTSKAKPSESQKTSQSSSGQNTSQLSSTTRSKTVENPRSNVPLLETTFCDNEGKERVVTFGKKPLGFEICLGVTPIRVDNVFAGSLSLKKGIEMGWYLTKVNDVVLYGKPFPEQFSLLKEAMANLPFSSTHDVRPKIQSLEIIFEDSTDCRPVPVTFAKKPLGIEFDVVAPITVKKIKEDCVARRAGVEVGWIVKGVAGTDLSTLHVTDQVTLLRKFVRDLPDVTYSIAPPLCQTLSNSGNASSQGAHDVQLDSTSLDDGRL